MNFLRYLGGSAMPEDEGFEEYAPEPIKKPCPICGHHMEHGNLETPGVDSIVHVQPCKIGCEEQLDLDVWLCRHCGHVELHVPPEYLEE